MNETSVGLYVEEKVKWNGWLRSTVGLRGDLYWATDSSSLAGNSAQTTAFLPQPKLGLVFGPFDKTEFYVNAGMGFHSNDVRGRSATGARRCWCSRAARRSACARRPSAASIRRWRCSSSTSIPS